MFNSFSYKLSKFCLNSQNYTRAYDGGAISDAQSQVEAVQTLQHLLDF